MPSPYLNHYAKSEESDSESSEEENSYREDFSAQRKLRHFIGAENCDACHKHFKIQCEGE